MSKKYEEAKTSFGEEKKYVKFNVGTQTEADDCEIRAEGVILEEFGIPVNYDRLLEHAKEIKMYHPEKGTSFDDFGILLEENDIPVTREIHGTIFNLVDHLGHGQKVIVAIGEPNKGSSGDTGGEGIVFHSVLVTGIDTSDPEEDRVVIQDPGTGEVGKSIPLTEFIAEWEQGECVMVSTTIPPPPGVESPYMTNFDYAEGNIQKIGDLSFDDFQYEVLPEISRAGDIDLEDWKNINESFADLTKGEISIEEFSRVVSQAKAVGESEDEDDQSSLFVKNDLSDLEEEDDEDLEKEDDLEEDEDDFETD